MPDKKDFFSRICIVTAAIALSGTTSEAVDLSGTTLCGIHMPAAFTGTALTFLAASAADGTYQAVKDSAGDPVSVTVAQGTYVQLDPAVFAGIQYLKVVSGSTEAAARTLTLAARPV